MGKTGIMTGILLAVIGLMMLMAPDQFIKVAVIVLGAGAVVSGVVNLTTMRMLINDPYFRLDIAIRGWLGIIIGILAVTLPLVFAATLWTIMVYVLAVYLLVSAGMEIYAISKLRAEKIVITQYIWEIVISVVAAIVLFIMPASVGLIVVRIIGVCLICAAVILLIYIFKNRPIIVEADSVDDEKIK